MLEQLIYQNHIGETFRFGENGIYVNVNDLHDYSWSVTKRNNRIASLDRGIVKKKLPVIVICENAAKAVDAVNRLHEIAEKDVQSMQYGRLIVNGYYYRCYITQSTKTDYRKSGRYLKINLVLMSDCPFWVKEDTYSFQPTEDNLLVDAYKFGYPFDYMVDYISSAASATKEIRNTGFVPSNFILRIYGASQNRCLNPSITIGGHVYRVFHNVGAMEYVTINSADKTITLTQNSGDVINLFASRDRSSYVFEQIRPGTNEIVWNGEFGFDITLLDERSEPIWI